MLLLPWWIYICVIGILISGYMAFKTSRADKVVDEEFIEKEGQVFIERIELERQKKREKMEEVQNDQSAS